MAFTFFFRDRETLDIALENVMPKMTGLRFIRIWDAGCAYGPEPYTLAILLKEAMSHFTFRNVKISATDIEPQFGGRIREGVYTREETGRIPPEIMERHFSPQGKDWKLSDDIIERVTFSHHDLLSLSPVAEGLSLIVCKNVLLHLQAAEREQVISMFHGALREGGVLVMENTQEMPGPLKSRFNRISSSAQVYEKN